MRHGARHAGLAVIALGMFGPAACGTVLGLNDYGDAPQDAGKDTSLVVSSEGGSGDGADSALDATEPDAPAATPDAGPEGSGDDGPADAVDDGSGDDGSDGDDGDDAADAPPDASADSSGPAYTAPPGWTLVAFADSAQTGCPAGFTGAGQDVVFDVATAVPQAGACACSACTLTTAPSCVTGAISGAYPSGSGTCSTGSQTLANSAPGGCNTDEPKSALASVDYYWNALPPSGGTCTSGAPTADPSQVAFAGQGRVCALGVDAGAPSPPSPFIECIVTAGVSACPPGPLSVAHPVGTGATITCASTCTCAATATCATPEVTYYRTGVCGGASLVMPATGVCTSEYGGNVAYDSYKYTATVTATACTAGGASAATVTGLAGEETVCCSR